MYSITGRFVALLALVCGAWWAEGSLSAAEKAKPLAALPDDYVELFDAIEAGQIEARFIPRDAYAARLFLTNRSDQPLNVKIPELVGAVPALAQFDLDPFGRQIPGQQANNTQNQSVGGGQQGNNPIGIFNIPAEGLREISLSTVCLEHGKHQPRAAVPYRLTPIEAVSSDAALHGVLREYLSGDHDRQSVQAAAWHLANGMSWKELAQIKGQRHVYRGRLPYFTDHQLDEARRLVDAAQEAANPPPPSRPKLESTAQN